MLKKILFIVAVVMAFGQNLYSADYYNYGQWHLHDGYATGMGGFIDKDGKLGEVGKEYIFFAIGSSWYTTTNTAYIYRVDTEGDPQMHLANPDSTGEASKRHFTLISSKIIYGEGHTNAFFVDNSGIYYGGAHGFVVNSQ